MISPGGDRPGDRWRGPETWPGDHRPENALPDADSACGPAGDARPDGLPSGPSGSRCSWLPRSGWHFRDAGRADASAHCAGPGAGLPAPCCWAALQWEESGRGRGSRGEPPASRRVPPRPAPARSRPERGPAIHRHLRQPCWWPGEKRPIVTDSLPRRSACLKRRSSEHLASRFPFMMLPRPCFSSNATKKLASATKKPARLHVRLYG